MKLYYSPGACSLSPHITLLEAGLPATLVKVDTKTHTLASGDDFYAINGKGYVPVLELDDGRRLTEGPAIVQYLADLKPELRLVPAAGSFERYRLQEWLNFLTSEVHKQFSPLFKTNTPDDYKAIAKQNIATRFDWLDQQLAGKDYLMGKQFSVADGYLFTMLTWGDRMKFDLSAMPNLTAYKARVAARPKVQEALKREGLAQAA